MLQPWPIGSLDSWNQCLFWSKSGMQGALKVFQEMALGSRGRAGRRRVPAPWGWLWVEFSSMQSCAPLVCVASPIFLIFSSADCCSLTMHPWATPCIPELLHEHNETPDLQRKWYSWPIWFGVCRRLSDVFLCYIPRVSQQNKSIFCMDIGFAYFLLFLANTD